MMRHRSAAPACWSVEASEPNPTCTSPKTQTVSYRRTAQRPTTDIANRLSDSVTRLKSFKRHDWQTVRVFGSLLLTLISGLALAYLFVAVLVQSHSNAAAIGL